MLQEHLNSMLRRQWNTSAKNVIHSSYQKFCRLATETESNSQSAKQEGDISSVFKSLSGGPAEELPPRFADIKRQLIAGREEAVEASWNRLLKKLTASTQRIAKLGSSAIPTIEYSSTQSNHQFDKAQFARQVRETGVAVIRGVVSEEEALAWKEHIREYIRKNPKTKAFPQHDPQVYELYWSTAQVQARSHSNMLKAQKFAMSLWHSSNPSAPISTNHPLTYADRLRIRQPGDASFALGPHIDGGSVERWEPAGYGRGGLYNQIFSGRWEDYDPWDSSGHLDVISDLYNGAGACSMFRMFQGWLSLSNIAPGEGTLQVNPLFKEATAYFLLRPFFRCVTPRIAGQSDQAYLDVSNWILDPEQSSALQGAAPASGQELHESLHPHLDLQNTMVHVPKVKPGDYVLWHCDTIHAVDKVHAGKEDSSVMYIPACPLTARNVEYLKRQREAFRHGTPGPDFPGGKGESEHVGRADLGILVDGKAAMGLKGVEMSDGGEAEEQAVRVANKILGF